MDTSKIRYCEVRDCEICFDTMKGCAVLECGHSMCISCCLKHFKEQDSCPFCRKQITNKNETNSDNDSDSHSDSHIDSDNHSDNDSDNDSDNATASSISVNNVDDVASTETTGCEHENVRGECINNTTVTPSSESAGTEMLSDHYTKTIDGAIKILIKLDNEALTHTRN